MRSLYPGLFIMVLPVLFFHSCKKSDSVTVIPVNTTDVTIGFIHWDQNKDLLFDTLAWATSKGYQYMVNDLQYFISGIKFHQTGGKWLTSKTDEGIHYVDAKAKTGILWQLNDELPAGLYDSVSFIFGLDEQDNISNRFVNPPERDMFWPEVLGGGYHYMKINMKYTSPSHPGQQIPFMFHLGIGQMYQSNSMDPDSIIGYIQNYFRVTLALANNKSLNTPLNFSIVMSLDRWFDGEYAFDFDSYPMGIMQSQQGLYEACRNGRGVFSITK